MKKFLSAIIFSITIFVFCSCVNAFPITLNGILESSDGQIIINMTEENCGDYGYYGKIKKNDGTFNKVSLETHHGAFIIWKYDDLESDKTPQKMFQGNYKQKGQELILFLEDGSDIVLRVTQDASSIT